MSKWFLSFGLFLIMLACSESSKYKGFSVTQTGLNYKIETLGEPYETVNDSDFITYTITQYSDKGEEITTSKLVKDTCYHVQLDTGLNEFIGLLNVGDSGSFVGLKNGRNILNSVKLMSSVSPQERKVVHLLSFLPESTSTKERKEITQWLLGYSEDSIEVVNGLFKIKQITGFGERPQLENEVVFHMESNTPSGKIIESTQLVNVPFSYFVGDQGQVIQGVDYCVRSMQNNERSVFIIPSYLAYGYKGSNTGIIAPNEPLLYKIDLIAIQ